MPKAVACLSINPAITVTDLAVDSGEPRVRDLRLAEALGFVDRHMIRTLIRRHVEALATFGELVSRRDEKLPQGGRPGTSFFLNKRQALYITAKSDTERAALVTVQMVEVFDAFLSGRSAQKRIVKPRFKALRSSGLRAFPIGGDSMEPSFRRGDFAMIRPVDRYEGEGVYVVGLDGPQAYRVEAFSGKVRMWSDNKFYGTHEVSAEWFAENVIGKAVFSMNCIDRRLVPDALRH